MKNTSRWCGAFALTLCISFAHAQTGQQSAGDSPAAQQARATREAVTEKQRQLFDEKSIPVDTQARPTATPLDLPQDEADAPGAVQK